LTIKVYGNDVEKALRIFKRQLQKNGLAKDMRRKRLYEKPSVRKKRKQKEAQRKQNKAIRLGF
jgi:small subunit ribosomal protein S21